MCTQQLSLPVNEHLVMVSFTTVTLLTGAVPCTDLFLCARMESRLVGHRSLCSAVCIIIQLKTGSAIMYVSACKSSTSSPRTIISKGLSKVVRKARLLSLSFNSLSRHSYLYLRSFICLSLNRWKTIAITAFLPSCGPLYNAITTLFFFFFAE